MTPEKEAKELIEKVRKGMNISKYSYRTNSLWKYRVKQCSLLVCETHLYSENDSPFSNIEDWKKDNDKWNRIKTAITNI